MAKKLVIENCVECPHRGHRGAFGRVAYIPVCRPVDRELGYTVRVRQDGTPAASYDGVVPDFCPLEDN